MKNWLGLLTILGIMLSAIQRAEPVPLLSSENFKISRSAALPGAGKSTSQTYKARMSLDEPASQFINSQGFRVHPGLQHIISIPGAITTLAALPGATTGSIELRWLTPGSDGTQGNIANGTYRIAYSTTAGTNFSYTNFQIEIATNVAPLEFQGIIVNNLIAGTTYFLRIFLADGATVFSYVSNGATATTTDAANVPGSNVISSIGSSSITVSWNANGNSPHSHYEMQSSTDSNFSLFSSSQTNLLSATADSLLLNRLYYFKVRTFTLLGATSPFNASVSTYTLANMPLITSFQVFTTSISVTLELNGNPTGTALVLTTGAFAVADSSAITSSGSNETVTMAGLQANTTYTFLARTVNGAGIPSGSVVAATTATYAAVPGTISFTQVNLSNIVIEWPGNGNPLTPPTTYQVQSSTESSFSVLNSSITSILTASFINLTPNTPYYFRVSAYNRSGGQSGFNNSAATFTLAASPGSSGFQIFTTSAAITLLSNNNSSNTVYRLYASTDDFITPSVSSAGTSLFFTLSGLTPNTSYQIGADALNSSQIPSTRTIVASTFTLPATPGPSTFTAIAGNSISIGWPANGNSLVPPTTYEMQVSTSADFSTFGSSVTFLTQSSSGGLTLNTLYNFRVRTIGQSGVFSSFNAAISTTTGANAPVVVGFQIFTTSISVTLSPNGNGAGTALSITTGSFSTSASSAGISGAGNTTLVLSNLISNRSYTLLSRSVSSGGIPSATVTVASTSTLPSVPGSIAINSVSNNSISISWGNNGNSLSPPTSYQVQVSSGDSNFGTYTSSDTFNISLTTASLAPATTYYFRVFAFGVGGSNSGFNASVATVTTSVPLTIPSTPTALTVSAISLNSITLSWTDNSTNESGFNILNSTGGIYGTAPANSTSLTISNLSQNILITARLSAFNSAGASTASVTVNSYTLSNTPAGTAASNVFFTSATLSWSGNGNPPSTIYQIQISPDSGFLSAVSNLTTALSFNFSNLVSSTAYFLKVRSKNGDGVFSTFDQTVSFMTNAHPAPAAPIGLTALGGDQKVTLDWSGNTDANLSGYNVYRATYVTSPPGAAPFNPALQPVAPSSSTPSTAGENFTLLTLTPVTTSFYVDTGLANGTVYYYKISAVSLQNVESNFSAIVSAVPVVRLRPAAPTGLLAATGSDGRFILSWSAVTQNEDNSIGANIAGYRIYRSPSLDVAVTLQETLPAGVLSWHSTDLASAGYWYLVKAFNSFGDESAESIAVNATNKTQVVTSEDNTLEIEFDPGEAVLLHKDSNKYNEDVRIVISRNRGEEQGDVLSSYDIKLFGVVSNQEITDLVLSSPRITLTFRYLPQASASAAAALRRTNLRALSGSLNNVAVFKYNGVEFIKLGGRVDTANGTIQILSASPSGKFQVRESVRATAFQISQTEPKKIFTPNGDGVNDIFTVYFENPKDSSITSAKIFTVGGSEITDMTPGLNENSLSWNGRNSNGEYVNSGMYIYQIQVEGKAVNGTAVVFR